MNTEQFNAILDHLDREATAHLKAQYRSRVLKLRAARRPHLFTDEHGEVCLRVPLNRHRTTFATVEYEVWLALQYAGADGLWHSHGNGSGYSTVTMKAPIQSRSTDKQIRVARVIKGLGAGKSIRFNNGNPLDLRSANLSSSASRNAKEDTFAVVREGISARAAMNA